MWSCLKGIGALWANQGTLGAFQNSSLGSDSPGTAQFLVIVRKPAFAPGS